MSRGYRDLLIEQKGAGLIRPGKRSLLHRVGFLLRAGSRDDRAYRAGKYLESRRQGGGFGKPGAKRRRMSPGYSNVYTNRTR